VNLGASLRVAVKSLAANKLRSLLTMLGVIIGVSAVIVVVAIGEGLKSDTLNRIQALGVNAMLVHPAQARKPRNRMGHLTLEDADALKREARHIAYVAPEISRGEQAKYRNLTHATQVVGTVPDWQFIRNFKIAHGRFINEGDLRARATVCVLGQTLVDELFYGRPQLGVTITIRHTRFTVVGILEEKGTSWMNPDDEIVIPLTTARTRLWGGQFIDRILLSSDSPNATDQAVASVTRVLRRRHRLMPGDDDDFRVRTQAEFMQTMAQVGTMMTAFLGSIALVSLLVGGVGIMNIMLVSVTERTREIGIRKAVGARPRDIMMQFLIESVVLSVMGGMIGIALGASVIHAIGSALGFSPVLSLSAMATAFFFAASVGIFFGLYPARKAAVLHPIAALRYE